jgi:superfamily II DNA/RNA helicase
LKHFSDLGVLPFFSDKLAGRSVKNPTVIQQLVIPPLTGGKSIIFRSATGTGKTFAYLLPVLRQILPGVTPDGGVNGEAAGNAAPFPGPAFMVCAPTLELCSQIKSEIEFLLPNGINVALLIGSVNLNRQTDSLKKNKPLIVVGNPGRLLLLAGSGKLKFSGLRFLVFDEADRLTADDCREETRSLVRLIADEMQFRLTRENVSMTVAACSATVTNKIKESFHPLLEDALFIETEEQEILRERIEHWAFFSEGRRKTQTLRSFIAAARPKKVLVFLGRSFEAGKIVSALQYHHIAAVGLYGKMDKKDRKEAVDRFRSGKAGVLVSSDLPARGLDFPDISQVIALDVPANNDAYIHRAGRTGRAGKRGVMVSIGDEVEMRRLAALEKKLGIIVRPKELYNGKVCNPAECDQE